MRYRDDFHNKVLIIVNWIYQKKQQGARYEDVYRTYNYYFPSNISTETFARKLRNLAKEGILRRFYDNKGRVSFIPLNPFKINSNPKNHFIKSEVSLKFPVEHMELSRDRIKLSSK